MDSKTCFVICPLGEERSETRKRADDLLELVLQPSLTRFDFEVIRADLIPGSGVITSEIIDLVQATELCIIDLTERNANVFYECGRRHETGKPFIQMIAKGESLPFDLAGIRTIFYDLGSARSVRTVSDEVERYVAEFEQQGYDTQRSGSSLTSLGSALLRMEAKLDRIIAGRAVTSAASQAEVPGAGGGLETLLQNPTVAVWDAISRGNVSEASAWLPRLESLQGLWSAGLLSPAALLAQAGDKRAHDIVMRALSDPQQVPEGQSLGGQINSTAQFYVLTGQESLGIEEVVPVIDKCLELDDLTNEDRAVMLNQKQRFMFAAGRHGEALTLAKEVVELAPAMPVFWSNLAFVDAALNDVQAAASAIDEMLKVVGDPPDVDQLAQAVQVYAEAERNEDAKRVWEQLGRLASARASLVATVPAVQQALDIA